MQNVSREKNKVAINVGSATSDLTGAQCSPNGIHWAFDTYMLAKSTGGATVKAGGDTLVLHHRRLRLRPCAGTRCQRLREGGRRQGARRGAHPFPATTDFSSFLVQAQAAGPKVLGLANAGSDTDQLREAGARVRPDQARMNLASLLLFITDVHALGLQTGQGLV